MAVEKRAAGAAIDLVAPGVFFLGRTVGARSALALRARRQVRRLGERLKLTKRSAEL